MIYYLSPYLPIQAASEQILTGSLVVFLSLFILSMFIGRFFCGWICPAGASQEIASDARNKQVNRKKVSWIKYLIRIPPWLGLVFYIVLISGGIRSIDFIYQTDHDISISNIQDYIIYYTMIFLFLLAVILAEKRRGCHSFC